MAANKLFVGNLPYSATNDQLRDLFASVGEVTDVNIINDRETGRSRGFGFVEMATDALAQEAIEALDGVDFNGRTLKINVARPRKPRN